ncbi:dockerin type I repeat-containing protein [Ruminococcus sp.]|uniref:dockerin type I repeat-containing protein n=1 Tax=Ruminococcus sp. TaxID=41978 RepID=UPI0025F0A6B6|nr:dockerin type I repeat-containing protein [Ruminococcus sp.]MBQ8965775.1 dockerin type I repeat-containing protein [Ruminococcus sp.]
MKTMKALTAFIAAAVCMSTVALTAFADEPVLDEETSTECVATAEVAPELVEDEAAEISAAVEGDVNGDGELNVIDLTLISAYVKGLKSVEDPDAADVNGDGDVNVTDVVLVAGAVKGIAAL